MQQQLQIEHLTKHFFAGLPVVNDVSFSAAEGEIVALLGPSGCGKTTTLRSVAGLEAASAGTIRIGGEKVDSAADGIFVPPQKRGIGMVFQSYAVWPHMTVAENVRYPLKNKLHRNADSRPPAQRVSEVLALVGLSDYADRSVSALSGGQMQRVALARSLVYRPKLLLLDEPLSNLDAKLRIRLREDLRRILKTANVTGLYVTHDQEEAVVIGDRIGIMNEGRLIQIGDPINLYNRPVDSFVADFTGATNQLRGEVVETDAKFAKSRLANGSIVCAVAMSRVAAGASAYIRTRPGNVRLHPSAEEVQNSLTGIITKRTFLGVSIIYELKASGFEIQAIESGSRVQFNVGDTVKAGIDPDLAWTYPEIAHDNARSPTTSVPGN